MRKYFLILLSLGIFGSALLTYSYLKLSSSENIVVQNLKLLSTGSGYVVLPINNNEKSKVIICPNNVLYYNLRGNNRLYVYPFYFYHVGQAIKKGKSLKVSARSFKALDHYTVDPVRAYKYEMSDLLRDTSFLKGGYVNYRLDWQTQKAVAYKLLTSGVNCFYGCESGLIIYKN